MFAKERGVVFVVVVLVLLGVVSYFNYGFSSVSEEQEFLMSSGSQVVEKYSECGTHRGDLNYEGVKRKVVFVTEGGSGPSQIKYCRTGNEACESYDSDSACLGMLYYSVRDGKWIESAHSCESSALSTSAKYRALCTYGNGGDGGSDEEESSDGNSDPYREKAKVSVLVKSGDGLISGANVDISSGSTNIPGLVTGSNGRISSVELPYGVIIVKVSKEGYSDSTVRQTITRQGILATTTINVELRQEGRVPTIVDREEGSEDEGSGSSASVSDFPVGSWCGYYEETSSNNIFGRVTSWRQTSYTNCAGSDGPKGACPANFLKRSFLTGEGNRISYCIKIR